MHTQLRIKNQHSCDFFSLYHLYMGSGTSTCVLAVEVRASRERLQSSCSENHLRDGGSCNQDFLQTSVALRWGHSGLYLLSSLKKSKTDTKKKKSHKKYILMDKVCWHFSQIVQSHMFNVKQDFFAIISVCSVCGTSTGNSFSKCWDQKSSEFVGPETTF